MATRRRFVMQAAGLAAAPFISTRVTRALAAAAEPKLGFALCGLGTLSTNQIAPALRTTAHCRLAAIITGTPAKAVKWQAEYNIPQRNVYNYETMHRIADNPDIDVVYVVTPNALHLECVRIAHDREFGAVKVIDAHFGFNIEPGVWRLKRALSGGGPLMDVGIYALQATRYLTGEEPMWISATTTRGERARFAEVEESVVWEARFPGGAVSHCSSSYNAVGVGYFRVLAERGWFGLDPAFNYGGLRGLRSDGQAIDPPSTDQFAAEMDDFARCILRKTPTRVPGEEGLTDVRIMTAIYESARAGKSIHLHGA